MTGNDNYNDFLIGIHSVDHTRIYFVTGYIMTTSNKAKYKHIMIFSSSHGYIITPCLQHDFFLK